MEALILKGKRKGKVVKISQWCNDWFSLMDGTIVSPSMLAFNTKDFDIIKNHKNNGSLDRNLFIHI